MIQESTTCRTGATGVSRETTDLSVIIVSHNVRALLEDCLNSVQVAASAMQVEVIVVDNGSSDGSAGMVDTAFPEYRLITCGENLGFSRANNLALEQAKGKYLLLLNPDTVLEPDVFEKMTAFMEKNPDVGMATCKLVIKDGSLDLACRRSFPTLWDGFCRAGGLSRLFSKSRLFARYNLTYLDENKTYEVEAVNGAFMFVRRQALDAVGPLDEDYFMYVEDLDWCYRFRKSGWKITYFPEARILHLKGQSGNPKSPAMIRRLFESTELFYRKHYFPRMGFLKRTIFVLSLRLWKRVTLVRNILRKKKQTRP